MKNSAGYIIITMLILLSAACGREEPRPGRAPLLLEPKAASPHFNDQNFTISADTGLNELRIHLSVHLRDRGILPTEGADTLGRTAFRLEVLTNTGPVMSDYCSLQRSLTYQRDSCILCTPLSLLSDTFDVRHDRELTFRMPMYAFHQLSEGTQTITFRLSQEIFTAEIATPDMRGYRTLTVSKSLFSASFRATVNVPKIHRVQIIGHGFSLRNDSSFTPAGMDNTLWKSSYPDLYWTVFYPKGQFYAQSAFQTSTVRYAGADTFRLYLYGQADSIGFGVYDHDNLSRDDQLGYWWGAGKELEGKRVSVLRFGNVDSFRVQLLREN